VCEQGLTTHTDCKTDTAIHTSIRTELGDKTLIIIAHRLQTICDTDKVRSIATHLDTWLTSAQIMVLEAGKIVQFDTPSALLHKDSGAFKALVDESSDRDTLYAMIETKEK
jgi:ABC-type multidrug transport system fused ATPase/permease subunit